MKPIQSYTLKEYHLSLWNVTTGSLSNNLPIFFSKGASHFQSMCTGYSPGQHMKCNSQINVTFYLICQVSELSRSSHPVMRHYVRRRLLGRIFTLAVIDMLTLPDSQTNHFLKKTKQKHCPLA